MSPRVRLVVAFVSTGLIGYIALGSVLGRVRGDSTYGQLAVFNEVVRIVLDAYVDPVNLDRTMAGARLGLTEGIVVPVQLVGVEVQEHLAEVVVLVL